MRDSADQSDSNLDTQLSLIQMAQANEPVAWDLMFRLYAPLIKQWARGSGVDCPYEVDNVCQEVFAKLIQSLSSFKKRDTGGSFRGWLRVITRNHIYTNRLGNSKKNFKIVGGSQWNRRLAEIPFDSRSVNSLFDSVTDEHPDEKAIIFRRIMAWIDSQYSYTQKTAFKRVVIDQHNVRDVAEDLNLTVNVVYQNKSRILARIREVFRDLV